LVSTKEFKEYVLGLGIDYVGITSMDRLNAAPKGHRPGDLLSKAESVVVIGLRIEEGVVQALKTAYEGYRHAIYSYIIYGYVLPHQQLNFVAYKVARNLEKQGYTSLPIPSGVPSDQLNVRGIFSLRHAAFAAGLGEFGWSTMFLNPEAGANLRLVSVITRASFDPDPLYSGTKLCDRKTCDVCIQVCPSGALNRDEAVSFQIDGRRVEYCRKDKWRCRWANRGLLKTNLGKVEVPIPDKVKPEDYLKALE